MTDVQSIVHKTYQGITIHHAEFNSSIYAKYVDLLHIEPLFHGIIMQITRLTTFTAIVCALSLQTINGVAADKYATDDSVFIEKVFKQFHFNKTALTWAVGTTKARMISIPSPCKPDSSEPQDFINTRLLQSAEFDAEIEVILQELGVIESAKQWSAAVVLGSLSTSQKAELLAIPYNSMTENIVGQWLWHGYNDVISNGKFFIAGTTAWKNICSPSRKRH